MHAGDRRCVIEMAIAFVLNRPADDLLDRIDEITTPGLNINPADGGCANPALEPATRRR